MMKLSCQFNTVQWIEWQQLSYKSKNYLVHGSNRSQHLYCILKHMSTVSLQAAQAGRE